MMVKNSVLLIKSLKLAEEAELCLGLFSTFRLQHLTQFLLKIVFTFFSNSKDIRSPISLLLLRLKKKKLGVTTSTTMVTTSGILGAQLTVKEPDFDQKNQLMTKQEKEKNLMVQQNKIRILFR